MVKPKMHDMDQQLIKAAGFSSTYEQDRLELLIALVVNQCLSAVKETPQPQLATEAIQKRFGRNTTV